MAGRRGLGGPRRLRGAAGGQVPALGRASRERHRVRVHPPSVAVAELTAKSPALLPPPPAVTRPPPPHHAVPLQAVQPRF